MLEGAGDAAPDPKMFACSTPVPPSCTGKLRER